MEEVDHGGSDSVEQPDERCCVLKSPVLTGDGVNCSASADPTESEKSTDKVGDQVRFPVCIYVSSITILRKVRDLTMATACS